MKKKVTMLLDPTARDLRYPIRRAQTIIQQLHDAIDVSVIAPSFYTAHFATLADQFSPLENGIIPSLQTIKPDLLLCDHQLAKKDVLQQAQTFIPSVIHLGQIENECLEDMPFESTLFEEDGNKHPFIIDSYLQRTIQELQQPITETMPLHLVVVFSERDPSKLTHRVLRHLIQLQIPLKITIVVGEQYPHDIMDLKMMALQRSHTHVIQTNDYVSVLTDANIALCSAMYFPYEVATIGIPCIVLAENETEMNCLFPSEEHGFLHLGLGRKIKQSLLLNAVMELILHEDFRRKMASLQLAQSFPAHMMILDKIHDALQLPKPSKNNPLEIKSSTML